MFALGSGHDPSVLGWSAMSSFLLNGSLLLPLPLLLNGESTSPLSSALPPHSCVHSLVHARSLSLSLSQINKILKKIRQPEFAIKGEMIFGKDSGNHLKKT